MIDLVTLSVAKVHLGLLNDDRDTDVYMKIHQASEIVMRYYKHETAPQEWVLNSSPVTYEIPSDMQAATLLVLGELFYNREAGVANILSDAVKSIIPRDPTLA